METIPQEDLECADPCAFPSPLHFLQMSHEEAYTEFLGQLESHVSEELRNSTDILNYLKQEGFEVFIPRNWTGIKGIEPLEFEWREDMPNEFKPKTRFINPKLFENAK